MMRQAGSCSCTLPDENLGFSGLGFRAGSVQFMVLRLGHIVLLGDDGFVGCEVHQTI